MHGTMSLKKGLIIVLSFSYRFFCENAWIECYDGARQLSSRLFQIRF